MSSKRSIDQPSSREILTPHDQLLIASANIIDRNGKSHDSRPYRSRYAKWSSPDEEFTFLLRATNTVSTTRLKTDYLFDMWDESANTMAAGYAYNSLSKHVHPRDKNGIRAILHRCDGAIPSILENMRGVTEPLSQGETEKWKQFTEHETFEANVRNERLKMIAIKALGDVGRASGYFNL